MTGQPIRVGLIGLGAISYAHEAGYAESNDICQITAMCDVRQEEVEQRCGMYGAAPYLRYQDLLDDPNIDLVDITTPHDLHYEIALAAIRKGKHVLVEKPITVQSFQGVELIEAAHKAGVTFSVAENTRFVTAYLEAEKLLQEGTLGEIQTVRTLIAGSEAYRIKDAQLWHGKAPYGGVILDSAVHHFYLYKWLFGGIRNIFALGSKVIPEGEMEDNGLMLGRLNNGAEYQLNVSCSMEIPWTERVEIYGSKAGVIIDQLANPVVKLYQGSNDIDGTVIESVPFDPLGWKFNSMLAEVKDFLSAIQDERPPLVDPLDALYALQAAEAAYRSIELKQTVTLES